MKAKLVKLRRPTPAQRKRAAEIEAIRMMYYEENRRLRADINSAHNRVSKLLDETRALKGFVSDQQLTANILLQHIKHLNPPRNIELHDNDCGTKAATQQAQVTGSQGLPGKLI